MPVLVTCKFDDDSIENTGAIVSTTFLRRSRAGNSKVNGRIWLEFELIKDFLPLLPVSLIMIRSILRRYYVRDIFSIYISRWKKFRYSRSCNPEAILRSGPKSNSSGILCLPWLKVLSCFSTIKFDAQEHGKIKRIVQFGPKSNSSKMI